MSFGIPQKSMEMIINDLMRTQEVEKASIFGSRAIWETIRKVLMLI